ncbi:MAG TPA: enoyl-CoA hydratase/isomerase family protein [Acidimicrobiales bacterium]|nr:enoyl-CoA hydratase/isomerase family protein [Acidimicrobiales bacterium]
MTDDVLDDQVRYRLEGGIAWMTLNRPDAGNALTPGQRNRMIELFDAASADVAVRVVVLRAEGRHFCTGADLRADRPAPSLPEGAPERPTGTVARMIATGAQRLIASVLDCEKPVIAAVGGTAAGIGAHLALASDLVIASEQARFIEVFVRRGIIPDGGGAYLLTRLIGLHKAKELVFFGDDLGAEEAARLGLVNTVVPPDALDATVREWAERLANGPTIAIGLAKRLLNRALDADRLTAFSEEATAQEMAMSSLDAQEGVASFVERRPTAFNGW